MTEIVNLRQVRKRKRRSDQARADDENRRAHGRSKAERAKRVMLCDLSERRLDSHRRTPSGGDEDR